MPIYEYECRSCGQVLDALQKISDPPLTHCPSCGHDGLKKLISAPRFRLKGSGWYETDFKDKGRRNIATRDFDKPAKEGGESKTSESKPAESKAPAPKPKAED